MKILTYSIAGQLIIKLKGELEHRSPKSRYIRTSRKEFIGQLTKIERRQARLRRIKARRTQKAAHTTQEEVATTPEVHHTIGASQNHPENITLFLQKYSGDPAIKVMQKFYREFRHINKAPHLPGFCA